jgi:hypothetical protein
MQGPGINDDGSGVSTMLETAEEMDELGITPRNKVRFIFFSGEEQSLLGSDYYVSQLTKKQIQDISVMLDFDMLASPNYGRFIYDGNGDEQGSAGSERLWTIEQDRFPPDARIRPTFGLPGVRFPPKGRKRTQHASLIRLTSVDDRSIPDGCWEAWIALSSSGPESAG